MARIAYANARTPGLKQASADTLAHALVKSGKHSEAVTIAREATQLAPRNHKLWLRLAESELASGNTVKAASACRTAIELSPYSPDGARAKDLLATIEGAKNKRGPKGK